jgi:diadenosine tetraphosphate (Ap4A) HIT family hydrolase
VHECDDSGICRELNGLPGDNDFERTYGGDPQSRQIHAERDWVILSDISPLVAGHILILPRSHHASLSMMSETQLDELEQLIAKIAAPYARAFGSATWIEHGSNGQSSHRNCLDHAHIHGVPVPLRGTLEAKGLERMDVRHLAEVTFQNTGRRYMYVQDDEARSIYLYEHPLGPQLIRRVIAESLDLQPGAWDWTVVVRRDLLRDTVQRLAQSIEGER